MITKAKFPQYMFLLSALIGGYVGIFSTTLIIAILLLSIPIEVEPGEMEVFVLRIWRIGLACILGAFFGQVFGAISGIIGFSLNRCKWISFVAAAFGGVVSSTLIILTLWI